MTNFTAQMDRINSQLAKVYQGVERPLAKADPPAGVETGSQITGEEFMAKALTAQAAGHITGAQLSECELRINAGKQPEARITKAVLTGTPYSPWG